MFFRIFQHLLPNAKAWRLTIDKYLRRFFQGLTGIGTDVNLFYDNIYNDINPQTTRELDRWDKQFGLRDTGLTEQERRDRLDATWKALGGQDPRYIQDTLQAAGFDVYVHQWWEPGTEAVVGVKSCATPRNPLMWLRRQYTSINTLVECGEELAECGEELAECGNSLDPTGYPLVNKIFITTPDVLPVCGEELAECGEELAECGNYDVFREDLRNYIIPLDPLKWPYFLYIGGSTFGTLTQIDPKRKNEFETLCLKICPTQQWLGILVEYT